MKARTIHVLTSALAVLAFFALASAADARTLYVANNGVDNAQCGLRNPCRSISRAISNAVARDTIIVGPGLYGDLNKNAILGEPGEETGFPGCSCLIWMDRPVTLISSDGAAATMISARHLVLERTVYMVGGGELGRPGQGFTITNPGAASPVHGAALAIESVTGTVRGNQIVSTHFGGGINGIRVYGLAGDVLIEGNEIRGWGNHGISLTGSGTTVRRNSIVLNDRGIRNEGTNTIEGNRITGNEKGIELFDDVTFVGNAVYGNRDGVQVYPSFTGPPIARNNIVSNRVCGLYNLPGVPFLMAANNYWGAATGPGPDPADGVCNAPGTSTQVTPFSTRPFVVTVPIAP